MDNLAALLQSLSSRGDAEAVTVMTREGSEGLSARQLADQARHFASGLRQQGLSPGDRIALIAENSPGLIAALLGVMASGSVAVPIDVQMEQAATRDVLKDCAARLVLTSGKGAERLGEILDDIGPPIYRLDKAGNARESDFPSWQALWSEQADDEGEDFKRARSLEVDDVVVMFYTSGTTGPPKGVPLSHRNLITQIEAVERTGIVQEGDRVLLPLPLHHVYPFVIGMLSPLAMGLPIILPRSLTGPDIQQALQQGRVTALVGVPRLYRALYEAMLSRAKQKLGKRLGHAAEGLIRFNARLGLRSRFANLNMLLRPLRRQIGMNLRVLASGGSPLDPELGRQLEGLGWKVTIGYGLTETSPLLTIHPPGDGHLDAVGRAIRDIELRIDQDWKRRDGDEGGDADKYDAARENQADSRSSSASHHRREGEILARGPSVFSGYWNLPDKTDQAFTSDGWFRTGDLGYLDQHGRLHVTGRVSTLIITEGGEKVQPDQIESAYAEADAIREIGVLQREQKLFGLVVPETTHVDAEGDVNRQVREAIDRINQNLPSHQRLNDVVITRKALPRTRIGKIRRERLKGHFQEAQHSDDQHAGPLRRNEMSPEDQALLDAPATSETWDMLTEKFPDQALAPDTNLRTELDVDSMRWLNVTMEIQQRTGVELDDQTLADVDTVRDLLRAIEQSTAGESRNDLLDDPESLLSEHQRKRLRPLGPIGSLTARNGLTINRQIVHWFFRLQVEGMQRLPAEGPLVIIANHLSHLDPFILSAALDHQRLEQTYWAAWVGATQRNPLSRLGSRLAKTIPIDPKRGVLSSLAFGAAVLQRGGILVWFPEGERSASGELQSFRPGLGILLERQPVPVVPAYIAGTHEALPKGSHRLRRRTVTIRFGEPIDPQELESQDQEKNASGHIVERLHEAVKQLGAEAP